MATSPTITVKPKRRWLQFSLRGLMLLMLVIAVLLGWAVNKLRQQRNAVAALEKMGCSMEYTDDLPGSPILLKYTRMLMGESDPKIVRGVNGMNSQMTDSGLVHLRQLPQLQWLILTGTQVTDAGLIQLRGLKQLQALRLRDTRVTDAGLRHLQGLSQLEDLDLCLTIALPDDAGRRELKKSLTRLRVKDD